MFRVCFQMNLQKCFNDKIDINFLSLHQRCVSGIEGECFELYVIAVGKACMTLWKLSIKQKNVYLFGANSRSKNGVRGRPSSSLCPALRVEGPKSPQNYYRLLEIIIIDYKHIPKIIIFARTTPLYSATGGSAPPLNLPGYALVCK